MKFGVAPPNFAAWLGADELRAITTTTEDLGYDSIWFGDHVAFVKEDAIKYGNAFLDAFTCLAFVAGFTERLRLGTDIAVVPYRQPVLQAKIAATIDVLSNGRLELGVGSGHVELESQALGVEYGDRGPMTDEYLTVMRRMWTEEMFSFHGRWVNFDDLCPLTLPIQQPLPLMVGGSNKVSMRRALDFDAAWTPMTSEIPVITRQLGELASMAEERGKPMPRVIVRWMFHPVEAGEDPRPKAHHGEIHRMRVTEGQMHDYLDAMDQLPVDEIILDFPAYQPKYLKWIETFARDFIIGRQ